MRTIQIAAVQMIAAPAPTAERLERAENWVAEAASAGAQLVVLPELFNTGYAYTDENYQRAEPITGDTARWMAYAAAQYHVHLAGTLLLRDSSEIYNSLLLFAPDGRMWRYDKNYPWQWERAYFREGRDIAIADTDLGRIGLMICWDACHPELWQRYAGKVELMVIASCPPAVHELDMIFPDGRRINSGEMGSLWRYMQRTSGEAFGENLRQQARYLGVPMVNTTGTGIFRTRVPLPHISLIIFGLQRPDLWHFLPQADALEIEAGYFNETYVADAEGCVLAQVPPEVEGYTLAEVLLPDSIPSVSGSQPRSTLSRLTYLADNFANLMNASVYRYKLHGEYQTPQFVRAGGLMLLAIWGLARIFKLVFHNKRLHKRYDRV